MRITNGQAWVWGFVIPPDDWSHLLHCARLGGKSFGSLSTILRLVNCRVPPHQLLPSIASDTYHLLCAADTNIIVRCSPKAISRLDTSTPVILLAKL
ncbi:hypothetical protein VTO42DRAFT_8016 [Malbranchea cinnamomea]